MKNFLFIVSLISLTACSGISNWVNNWTEYTTASIASTISKNNFTKKQQEDLYYLFEDLLYAKNCTELQNYIDNNLTLYDLELEYNLKEGFIYDEALDFKLSHLLTNLANQDPSKTAMFAVVTSWKQSYVRQDIDYAIKQIKKCYPNSHF